MILRSRSLSQRSRSNSGYPEKNVFCNNSCTIGRTLTKLGMRVDIDKISWLKVKVIGSKVKVKSMVS